MQLLQVLPTGKDLGWATYSIMLIDIKTSGIANLTDLAPGRPVRGFDCGPGNLLLDAWVERHQGRRYDEGGHWAAQGEVLPQLLQCLLEH